MGRHTPKTSRRAAEQARPELKAERAAWREEFTVVDPARLDFVDETSSSTSMDRTHGRVPSSARVDSPAPHDHWKVVTLTAAVHLGDAEPCLSLDGAAFETYDETCLAPTPRFGDVVNLDNPAWHKTAAATRLVDVRGWSRNSG